MHDIVEIAQGSFFQSGQTILSGVDLSVSKGEFVYLTGSSGSGKSTLLKTLYGALAIQAEKAMIAEQDLLTLKVSDLPTFRRKLGMVFQDFRLLQDKTVRANLYIVMKATGWTDDKMIKTRISEILDLVGLSQSAKKLPHQISGGEQQRLAVARALINDPVLLLADEPTGNLDPDTSDTVIRLIRELTRHKGVAVICATHDFNIVKKFPSAIYHCEAGKLLSRT